VVQTAMIRKKQCNIIIRVGQEVHCEKNQEVLSKKIIKILGIISKCQGIQVHPLGGMCLRHC